MSDKPSLSAKVFQLKDGWMCSPAIRHLSSLYERIFNVAGGIRYRGKLFTPGLISSSMGAVLICKEYHVISTIFEEEPQTLVTRLTTLKNKTLWKCKYKILQRFF